MKVLIIFVLFFYINLWGQLKLSDLESSTILIESIFEYGEYDSLKNVWRIDSTKRFVHGTGFFVYDDTLGTDSYYLITNRHIVEENSKILSSLYLRMKYAYNNDILLKDYMLVLAKQDKNHVTWKKEESDTSDVVVIKWEDKGNFEYEKTPYKPIMLSEYIPYDSIKIGDSVITIGYPWMDLNSQLNVFRNTFNPYEAIINRGFVVNTWDTAANYLPKTFNLSSEFLRFHVIVTKLNAQKGQSGSPLFIKRDNRLFLVGVVTATYSNFHYDKKFCLSNSIESVIKIIKENKDFFIEN